MSIFIFDLITFCCNHLLNIISAGLFK